jgi:hypothetical protein
MTNEEKEAYLRGFIRAKSQEFSIEFGRDVEDVEKEFLEFIKDKRDRELKVK